jgi:hypothetical protein
LATGGAGDTLTLGGASTTAFGLTIPCRYVLPWVRVLILIHSITSATWGHEAWPQVKPVLRRALEMRRQIAREGWWN